MKNIKLFLKIYISFLIIAAILLIILQILGLKTRVGYITKINLNTYKTLELNNLIDVKENFIVDYKLDEKSLEEILNNYLLTNENITNYVYQFKIGFYDKIFKNSDIYGVYPDLSNLPNYMENAEMEEGGSPYGNFIFSEIIEEDKIDKIDNINYTLKLKNKFILYCIIVSIIIILIALLFFIIKILNNILRIYILLFTINILLYYLMNFILPKFSILTFRISAADIFLSYIFLIIAFNLLNKKILLTLLFESVNIFSFFVIEPIALTMQNTILLFSDMPILYPSLLAVLSVKMKIIVVLATIIYFGIILFLIILFVINLIKMKRKKSIIIIIVIFVLSFTVFFRERDEVKKSWAVHFTDLANRNGIINAVNYRISFDRINKAVYSKDDVLKAINILKEVEATRDYSNLLLSGETNCKRDVFLIFLESFYDYSHFVELFDEDPFPKEYREWASKSAKIIPNVGSGSFYARLSGLTGASPLKPQVQIQKISNTLPDLLKNEGYYTLALEEAITTYNLDTFLPSIGFEEIIFSLGATNIKNYIDTNFNNLRKPIFVYGFTLLGHAYYFHLSNFNVADNNKNFINSFKEDDRLNISETLENSVVTATEIIKTRDAILKYSPNALIIFKHDHFHPFLISSIENSNLEDKYKKRFFNDYAPNPILIWNGTNGAYKAPNNFMPENIPMFIAINSGVTNYRGSIISLLYKDEIDNMISSYNNYYRITNDNLIFIDKIETNSKIFQYERAQKILSQDIFQGKKFYFDNIK